MFWYDPVRDIYVWRFRLRGEEVWINLSPAEHFDRLWRAHR